MIAKELEVCLHHSFVDARRRRHEYITTDHLLLAVLREGSAAVALVGSQSNVLQSLRADLAATIEKTASVIDEGKEVDTQPTTEFQRVIQRAILKVQSGARSSALVTSADVLLALFGEKRLADFLEKRGISQATVVERLGSAVQGADADSASEELPREIQPPPPESAADLQVVLLNDDQTPIQFVVDVLEKFFLMNRLDATETMMEVHREGKGLCGLYAREDALSLIEQVTSHAERHGWPLRCVWALPK